MKKLLASLALALVVAGGATVAHVASTMPPSGAPAIDDVIASTMPPSGSPIIG